MKIKEQKRVAGFMARFMSTFSFCNVPKYVLLNNN